MTSTSTADGTPSDSIITAPISAEPMHQVPCAICRRQFSKYTCSRCNVPYCSLTCYKSEKHADCSETFYRQELENDIHIAPSKTKEEREQMLQLLQRFEEEDQARPDVEGEDDGEDDLTARLQGIDLDSVSSDHIWELLTPEERKQFTQALHDPNGELAKQLLSSEAVAEGLVEPWWMSEVTSLSNGAVGLRSASTSSHLRFGTRPAAAAVPSSLRQQASLMTALRLVYNGVYISIAYAYVTRRLLVSPLSSGNDEARKAEARRMVGDLVPFLVDRRSRTMHETLPSVVTDVFARFEDESRSGELLAFVLEDASRLLHPSVVSEVQTDNAFLGACENLILCISDLHDLFSHTATEAPGQQAKHDVAAAHKLLFYAAHLALVPAAVWQGLSHQLSTRAERELGTRA